MNEKIQVRDIIPYSPFPHKLARDKTISPQAKALFAVYGSFINVATNDSWASEEYLCELMGDMNPKTFRKYKRELLDSGWISQEQLRDERGFYSILLITRNHDVEPRNKSNMLVTGDQKMDVRQNSIGRPKNGRPKNNRTEVINTSQQKKHTTHARVLPAEVSEYIEGEIAAKKRSGELKSEGGLRYRLRKLYESGELVIPVPPDPPAKNERCTALRQVDEWERELRQNCSSASTGVAMTKSRNDSNVCAGMRPLSNAPAT